MPSEDLGHMENTSEIEIVFGQLFSVVEKLSTCRSLAGCYFPRTEILNEPHKLVYDDIVKFLTCLGAGQ